MKAIITIESRGKTITELLTALSLVIPQLEAVGTVSFSTQDDEVVVTQPLPQSPEVPTDNTESQQQERERLKTLTQRSHLQREGDEANVDFGIDPRSKKKRIVE